MMLPLLMFCFQIIDTMPATMNCETSQQEMETETIDKLRNKLQMLEMKNELLKLKNQIKNKDRRIRQLEEQLKIDRSRARPIAVSRLSVC